MSADHNCWHPVGEKSMTNGVEFMLKSKYDAVLEELAQAISDRQREHDLRVRLAGELEVMTERKQRAESQAEQLLTRIRDQDAELHNARLAATQNKELADHHFQRCGALKAELASEKVLADAAAGACCDYLDRIEALEKDNEIYRLANRALTQRDGSHVARSIVLESQLEATRIDLDAAVEQRDMLSSKTVGLQKTIRLLARLKSNLSAACHRLAHMNPSEEANDILASVHLSRVELPHERSCQHDLSKPATSLNWLGSTPDINANTFRWWCAVCCVHFDLPCPQPAPVRA
jgi:hypothetical protein